MRISEISGYQNTAQKNNVGFKAVYPVYYWYADCGNKFTAATTAKMTKTLNGKVIRTLNNPKNRPRYNPLKKVYVSVNELVRYIANVDTGYGRNPIVRSFYNYQGGLKPNKFEPFAYIITGDDVATFDKKYGVPIGIQTREAPIVRNKPQSAELTEKKSDYVTKGLNFVKTSSAEWKCQGMPYGLHIRMQKVRTRTGTDKGYNIIDYRFYPERGAENPFKKEGYLQ